MKWISAFFALTLFLGAKAQETVYPATIFTHEFDAKQMKSKVNFSKTDDVIELPFIDDFSVDRFPGNFEGRQVLWEERKATRNTNFGANPPTIGVVSFDGADEVGYPYDWTPGTGPADTLTSCPINLEGEAEDQIGISFFYQPRGNSVYGPGVTDSLRLEFYSPELDEWRREWATADLSNPEEFTFVYIPITLSRYLQEGFRFRFVNFARLQGVLSVWNVDYVWVDRNGNNNDGIVNDIAFSRQEHTLLEEFTTMPRNHFASDPIVFMRDDITVELNNLNDLPRTLENNGYRVSFEGTATDQFANSNEPAIAAGSNLDYTHAVGGSPNFFAFNPSLGEGDLEIEVEIYHGVSDFFETQSNDTMRFTQKFSTDYAYDDGTAEAAYGVPQSGEEVAMRFTNFITDSVFAIRIYTMPFAFDYETTPITIKIWEDTGNGPGEIIAETLKQVAYGQEEYQELMIYTLPEPIELLSGSYFYGYSQAAQFEGIRIGLDLNTDGNSNNLWFRSGGPLWSASSIPGTAMIRPMFTSDGYDDIFVSAPFEDFSEQLNVFPNPAQDFFNWNSGDWEPVSIIVMDVSGRVVIRQTISKNQGRISSTGLSPGMYVAQFKDALGNKAQKKILIRN